MEQRNPYLLLGIPFGASREQANIAFARRTKALRRVGDRNANRDQLTDLTWALNQIDEAATDISFDVYRIPADPATFGAPGAGVLAPRPETLAPRPGDREAALVALEHQASLDLLRYLVLLRSGQVAPVTF